MRKSILIACAVGSLGLSSAATFASWQALPPETKKYVLEKLPKEELFKIGPVSSDFQDALREARLGHPIHIKSSMLTPENVKLLKDFDTLTLQADQVDDDTMRIIGELTNLKKLNLDYARITPTGASYLKGLTKLEYLSLNFVPELGDAGIANVAGLTILNGLGLINTGITNEGLASLKGLTNLKTLILAANEKIDDAGLVHLKGLTNLIYLSLRFTKVTEAGVKELQKALPNTKITK
jgi:Leucine-rich repeat (LRR) protein